MHLLTLLPAALAADDRTPLCAGIADAIAAGDSKRSVVATMESAGITPDDLECLHATDLPGWVTRKAQTRLVRDGGLDALPTAVVDVWAVLPDQQLATMATSVLSAVPLVGTMLEGTIE